MAYSLFSYSFVSIISHTKCRKLTFIPDLLVLNIKSNFRYFSNSPCYRQSVLTPQEIDAILRFNEFSHDFKTPGPVKSYDSNQLPSNNPMEDARAEAKCLLTNKILAGIFDGHAGAACAQVVAKRLFKYISVTLLSKAQVADYTKKLNVTEQGQLLESFNDKYEFVQDLREIYDKSFVEYVKSLGDNRLGVGEGFEKSFLGLDDDLSREAAAGGKSLTVGMSGCVACVAQVEETNLHVASTGDCQAVLGSLSDSNVWIAKKLSIEHNSDNPAEVDRILSEHPPSESSSVIKTERLLGQLAPLRAFGDFRYKWSRKELDRAAVPVYGAAVIPPHYHTPPYLTAKPDVTYHRLTSRDKFLVIASDGLWDLLSPLQAVRLVGEYMRGRVALTPLRLPKANMRLGEVASLLDQRHSGVSHMPVDFNAATHLMRHALGGSDLGVVELPKLSHILSIPQDMVRLFRDDITITVLYFDSDFLRHCPM